MQKIYFNEYLEITKKQKKISKKKQKLLKKIEDLRLFKKTF